MSEIIRPEQIATFWKFPVVDIPIEKLSLYIKRNMSPKLQIKQWEPINDPGTIEMLRFPITEEDVLNVLGPGEYQFFLQYTTDEGRPVFYGKGVYLKVGIEEEVEETPPEDVAHKPSPEIEMLKATLEKYDKRDQTMMEMLTKLAGQEKSTDSQFKDQLLMKLVDGVFTKMGNNQVDVGSIYAKALDTSALLESKRFDIMADTKKEETELKRQESKQKHEIDLIKLEQRLEAGAAGLGELKNDGSPEDEVKKTNVVQDIVDAITKIGPVIDNFGEFVAKVKPTLISIKDIIGIAKGMPLAGDVADEGGEGSEEEEPLVEEEPPAEEPEPPEDDSPATAGKDEPYDPNDPRKQ